MTYNVLARAAEGKLTNEPFPTIVIDNALPQDVYDRLAATYPDPERLTDEQRSRNNHRFNLLTRDGVGQFPFEEASDEWRAFTEENASTAFVERVYDLFPQFLTQTDGTKRVDVSRYGPDLMSRIGVAPSVPLDEVSARVTIGVNTPVREQSSVRGAHMDNLHKAYVALLYFRPPEDDSTGGDLELFRWKDGAPQKPWSAKVPRDQVEVVTTVPYAANRLVLFLNTHNSLHGVSPRSVTPHWRRLVVVSGYFKEREEKKKSPFQRLARMRSTLGGLLKNGSNKQRDDIAARVGSTG